MFIDEVKGLLEVKGDGRICCKLSDEQKEAIQKVQTAKNTEMHSAADTKLIKTMEISAAIEARATRTSTQDVSGVYADEIQMTDFGRNIRVYPCAVAKATNIATSGIKNATVNKLYAVCRGTHSERGLAAKNTIRNDWGDLFGERRVIDTENLVKATTARDTVLSATVFPGDIHLREEIVRAINSSVNLKAIMIAEFLESLQKDDKGNKVDIPDSTLLAAYRNINRSLLDDIFDAEYAGHFGKLNDSDPVAVATYNNMLRDYRESLGNIGAMYLSSDTIEFGLNVRKLTISEEVIWTNAEKVGRVKRYGTGSYYVSSNEDCGVRRIPTSSKIVDDHFNEIMSLTDACMAIVENEARLENDFPVISDSKTDADGNVALVPRKIVVPDITLSKDFELSYAARLGINSVKETEILEVLQAQAKERAVNVCKNKKAQISGTRLDNVTDIMAGMRR